MLFLFFFGVQLIVYFITDYMLSFIFFYLVNDISIPVNHSCLLSQNFTSQKLNEISDKLIGVLYEKN